MLEQPQNPKLTSSQHDVLSRSEASIRRYIDALWLERGLSDHTRSAYASDLRFAATQLALRGKHMEQAQITDLLLCLEAKNKVAPNARSTGPISNSTSISNHNAGRASKSSRPPYVLRLSSL